MKERVSKLTHIYRYIVPHAPTLFDNAAHNE